jgi:hypothetical protein
MNSSKKYHIIPTGTKRIIVKRRDQMQPIIIAEKTELQDSTYVETNKGRKTVLAILERASEESEFLSRLAENPHEALAEYYNLSSEEKAALASGDIKKIESWLGKLDDKLATWLWCRLSQEKW